MEDILPRLRENRWQDTDAAPVLSSAPTSRSRPTARHGLLLRLQECRARSRHPAGVPGCRCTASRRALLAREVERIIAHCKSIVALAFGCAQSLRLAIRTLSPQTGSSLTFPEHGAAAITLVLVGNLNDWLEAANRVKLPLDERFLQTNLVCADRTVQVAKLAGSRNLGAAPSAERPAT